MGICTKLIRRWIYTASQTTLCWPAGIGPRQSDRRFAGDGFAYFYTIWVSLSGEPGLLGENMRRRCRFWFDPQACLPAT